VRRRGSRLVLRMVEGAVRGGRAVRDVGVWVQGGDKRKSRAGSLLYVWGMGERD